MQRRLQPGCCGPAFGAVLLSALSPASADAHDEILF
jgi:hypothetical protein